MKIKSKQESGDAKLKPGFLKGVITGAVAVGLLASIGFSYMSQEKEVSQEELFSEANVAFRPFLEDHPAFSSPEWQEFSKALTEENLDSMKILDNGDDYTPGSYWWPDLKDRQIQAHNSYNQSVVKLFEKMARENAVNVAIMTCRGSDPEDIKDQKKNVWQWYSRRTESHGDHS